MLRTNYCPFGFNRIVQAVINPCSCNPSRLFSKQKDDSGEMHFNEQQAPYYTAKDVEFCPNRAKEVMQNHVQETAENACNEGSHSSAEIGKHSASTDDQDHVNMYQSGNSVSLHSVMQSNVPEPYGTKDKAPTHLNMPGSSSSQDCKYLAQKIESTHQSKQ